MSAQDAIMLAAKYGIEEEIRYAIEDLGMDPEDALMEWDI